LGHAHTAPAASAGHGRTCFQSPSDMTSLSSSQRAPSSGKSTGSTVATGSSSTHPGRRRMFCLLICYPQSPLLLWEIVTAHRSAGLLLFQSHHLRRIGGRSRRLCGDGLLLSRRRSRGLCLTATLRWTTLSLVILKELIFALASIFA